MPFDPFEKDHSGFSLDGPLETSLDRLHRELTPPVTPVRFGTLVPSSRPVIYNQNNPPPQLSKAEKKHI